MNSVGISPVLTKAFEFGTDEVTYSIMIAFAAIVFAKLVKNYLFSAHRYLEDTLQTAPVSVKFSLSVMRKWIEQIMNKKDVTRNLIY